MTQQFTVSELHLTYKRGELDRAILTDAHGTEWETAYTDTGPVLGDMDEGDRVTGTIWRGRVTEVAMNGDSQDTETAPDDLRALPHRRTDHDSPPASLVKGSAVHRR
ncbi:hypothetical protein [Actinomadura latina]|uniref:Uncharacterized protein n=1 Tax=Actinomadura latina TaxID=163603 RepID=A0A846Z2Q7_9ACTN|nr:hypothetical protein [Actinomadura latina]NKZ06531.1 hypothetical protein [Actinomadura latina]